MSERPILEVDQPFLVRRNSVLIAGSPQGTPITGAGPGKPTEHFINKRVQFAGVFGGAWDIDLEGTVDGTNWVKIQETIVAATIIEVAPYWQYMRLNTQTLGNLTTTGSKHGVADQPDFTAYLGGLQLASW